MAKAKTTVAPSKQFSTIATTLLENRIADELQFASNDRRRVAEGTRTDKKNYAELLSRALAQRFADALRSSFNGILPNPDGSGQESKARTGKGLKKLDVNYSTVELGLGLGVSIKTINFRDPKTRRYTKNSPESTTSCARKPRIITNGNPTRCSAPSCSFRWTRVTTEV